MGYMRHHAIIVTTYGEDYAKPAHDEATRLGMCPTEIVTSSVNDYRTFMCPTDGSKEGWRSSDDGDERREQFVAWLVRNNDEYHWCEVQYGDDNGHNLILRTDETEPVPAHLRSTP